MKNAATRCNSLQPKEMESVAVEQFPSRTEKRQDGFNFLFFKRFVRLIPWLFPSWRSIPSLLLVFLLCLGLLEQYVIYNIGNVPSKYYKALGEKDHSAFWRLTGIAVSLIVSEAFIKSTTLYISTYLYLQWRDNITRHLHQKYFKEVLYYAINVVDKSVDNPDQRITQDVDKLCSTLSQIMAPLIISPFTIAYYIYKSHQSSGYLGPVSVLVFFIIGTVFNKLLMSPVVRLVFLREKMEGNFRYKHMQIRSNSESAAFYRSGKIEEGRTNHHLANLINTQRRLILREYALNFSVNTFDYLGSILSYIAIGVPIFLGTYDALSAPDLSALISANAFVMIYLINCFTTLIDLSVQVTNIAGTTHRVVELREKLEQLYDAQQSHEKNRPANMQGFGWSEMETLLRKDQGYQVEAGSESETEDPPITALRVNDLTFVAPKSTEKLCIGLCFDFKQGVNILVTGDSGCGKSSLLRVINGIWPELRGTVTHGVEQLPHRLLYLPQRPYFTDGSLRQQVIYPLQEFDRLADTGESDDIVIEDLLSKSDLGHLKDRVGGLDTQVDWNWYDHLSPGEMQRLSFTRLFYHKPKFAVLDEATSQVGVDMEERLYSLCSQLGITLLSVGHRDTLRKYHHVELHIEKQGTWSLKPLSAGSNS
ncbi:lysosomal cobalamin transporter ABCD4-like isoform X2 [Dreissena polymorpha]|nr:lysosomal cobalamin transporter ABCD4-like isoform X2 [Dreissena polymorpha]